MTAKNSKAKRTVSVAEREEALKKALDEATQRMATGKKEREYFRPLLEELVRNNAIPVELLQFVPVRASEAGKTRFDQLYDAAMLLAFPGYRKETLQRLLAPGESVKTGTKIWRVTFPEKFGLSHVLIRAESFQEAFALGCDYACRVSLRMNKRIPVDLTVRVMIVTERALRRKLDMRWANRVQRRKQLQLEARIYTPKELAGARMAAIGHPKDPKRSLARYVEAKDLQSILKSKGLTKVSAVEAEIPKKELVIDTGPGIPKIRG